MIEEAYVSFETAKLLKEKGFDEPCEGFYVNSGVLSHTLSNANNSKWNEDKSTIGYISAPTQQMALRWLREVHYIFIEIWFNTEPEHMYCDAGIYGLGNERKKKIKDLSSYEEAVEAALKYTLKNLI